MYFECRENLELRDENSRKHIGDFLGPGSEEKWYGSSSCAQKGEWDSTANTMVQRF